MKTVITLLLTVLPGIAFAHGGHQAIAEPLHTVSHWGHVLGVIIIVGAVIAFYRKRDET